MPSREVGDPSWLALWAKSACANGRPHSLVGHLLDSGAVGELIWDEFLALRTRSDLDRWCNGQGRAVLTLLCGWHDLGKATPAFQAKHAILAEGAERAGFALPIYRGGDPLRHGFSGVLIAQRVLAAAGARGTQWLLPIISGHHGLFTSWDSGHYRASAMQNGPTEATHHWLAAQDGLAESIANAMGVDLTALNLDPPPLAGQLAIAGYVSMADWIASSDAFAGLGAEPISWPQARERARSAWTSFGLRGGWDLRGPVTDESFVQRFGNRPRPVQAAAIALAEQMTMPGLLILEAPMGEGKTEAALAVAEVLSARFGLGGFFFAMPTQGTTDAMFERVREWAQDVDSTMPVALLHGKAMANEHWRSLQTPTTVEGICDDGDDPYGFHAEGSGETERRGGMPAQWLLGRHRPLLSPGGVGTVDQALIAATHIKYVALRYAGLVGKVLVIDEVHSYDIYMSQYLHQLLAWCSDAQIPVVLMSATLPPDQRRELISAYARGLEDSRPLALEVDDDGAYPRLTSWTPASGLVAVSSESARPDLSVHVEPMPMLDMRDTQLIADAAVHATADGGSALVILNTVRRAQEVYRTVKAAGAPTVLLHGRLTTAERANRTSRLVELLGSNSASRPHMVVVATQIAEQSFDIDADILITDIAPMDLLLQRIGRLHRHAHHDEHRPGGLRDPRVLVTGIRNAVGPPEMVREFGYVYDRHSILRSAALIGASGSQWLIPSMTPGLVARAYDPAEPWPTGWEDEANLAETEARRRRDDRAARGKGGVLAPPDTAGLMAGPILDRLHARSGAERHEEWIAVRDGEPSIEVALVRRMESGYVSLSGHQLGIHGERCEDAELTCRVLGDTVRINERDRAALLADARPLDGWADLPLLSRLLVIELDGDNRFSGPSADLTYDEETGLTIERRYRS